MKRFLLLIAGLGGLLVTANAQDSTFLMHSPTRTVFKWAPLSLLDPDATLQFGLEHRTGPRTSVQGELGYGWGGLSLFQEDAREYSQKPMWRVRSEVRFYSGRYRNNRRNNIHIRSAAPYGNYTAIEAFFKAIPVQQNWREELRWNDGTWRGYGDKLFTRPVQRTVLGIHGKFGRQFPLIDRGRESSAVIVMDIYIGAGIRYAVNRKGEIPPNTVSADGYGFYDRFSREGGVFLPSLTAGLKLGFIR